jgi:hypothetical protein
MKPIEGYDLVNEAGEFKRLPAGIYGVKITKVVDNPQNQYLEIYCDIVKGDFKDYFKTLTDAGLKDTSLSFRSYKQNALPFFKAFITAVEKTNPGYHWDWDETKLVGKNVIAVFGEEEYLDKNGEVKVGTRVAEFRSVDAWKEGKLKVPELKKLPPKPEAIREAPVEDTILDPNDLPF